MAKVYLFGGKSNKSSYNLSDNSLMYGYFDFDSEVNISTLGFTDTNVRCDFISYVTERYYINEMCFDRFDLNLRAIETNFFIVGSTERSELDQINQKLIRYANRGVRITASRVRVV